MSRPIIGRALTARALLARSIISSKGSSLLPPISSVVGLTSGYWSGANQVISTPILNTYSRLGIVSATVGELPADIIDNNDCSFTNVSGVTKTISGRMVIAADSTNTIYLISAGSDNSGSDAPIIINSGAWSTCHLGYTIPFFDSVPAIATKTHWVVTYSVELLAGKSVFPLIKNISNTTGLSVSSVSHKIWSR